VAAARAVVAAARAVMAAARAEAAGGAAKVEEKSEAGPEPEGEVIAVTEFATGAVAMAAVEASIAIALRRNVCRSLVKRHVAQVACRGCVQRRKERRRSRRR